ncbi:sigma-70 family RNA polymerase sigma factor [bacterium]|nr:sigma-70 family RNA polymerase sigma factor [bacterium]
MAATSTQRYRHPAIRQLAEQQLRFAPVNVRLEQVSRVEQLISTLSPQVFYPYPALVEQITTYRSEMYPNLEIRGRDLLHDLRCFAEDLSGSANQTIDQAPEPVLSVEDVSQRFNVSIKTVTRWRDRGLISRQFRAGRRTRIGFLKSTVDRFAEKHRDEVVRGGQFSQLSDDERGFIIRRARRLARYGASPTETAQRLARRTGRAVETIRYTLKSHDEKYPESAVFPAARRPLTGEERREIFRRLKYGESATRLARQFGRTRSSIHRIAQEYRTRLLIDQPIEYVESDEFLAADAETSILADDPDIVLPTVETPQSGTELPAYLSELYGSPVLTREQEQFLFRRMNFLKFQAGQIRNHLTRSRQKARDMERIEELLEQSLTIKNVLIRCNLRLVVSVARKHRRDSAGFFEMISDGNMTLIRAIEKFDYRRGNKFSTYATWALMRSYARSVPAEGIQLDRFRTGTDELIGEETDARSTIREDESRARQQQRTIESILDQLNEREQEAISLRFALEGQPEPLTLEQIGDRLGVSRERARQIINTGLEKLRTIAEDLGLDTGD